MEQTELFNNMEERRDALCVLDDYSVIVAEREGLQKFFLDGENLQKMGDRIEKLARGLVADVSTKEGISQVKTAARQIASVRKKVDEIGKNVVAELKALPNVIDNNRKEFRERMEALQEEIRRPVTEIEEREKAIDDIKGTHFNCAAMDSKGLSAKIEELEMAKKAVTESVWKESYVAAVGAYEGEIKALAVMRDAAAKHEEEARRLAELEAKQEEADRIIREQKIKEEAEAKAAEEMARLKREKAEAEHRAAEAEARARNAENPVQRAAIGAHNAVAMSKTVPQQKATTWTPEMKAVNNAIVSAIAGIIEDKLQGFTPSGYDLCAREIVKAIIKGQINNLKVEY